MAKDWRVVIDDSGDQFSGWPLSVWSDAEDRAVLHQGGFIQKHWGCHLGGGPTLKEALDIAQAVVDFMNAGAVANTIRREVNAEAQGLDTAPKDGTYVDLWLATGERVTDARWLFNAWRKWGVCGFASMGWVRVDGRITHWTPIPAPPTS